MTKSVGSKHTETADPHWLEWLVGGVCTFLVVSLFVWISWDIYRYEDQAAQFEISLLSVQAEHDKYRVIFDIHNTSLSTAAEVHVRGDLSATDSPESSDVTFDYVASESHETGILFFKKDPASGTFNLNVVGYTQP